MNLKRPRAIPGRLASTFPGWPAIPVCLLAICAMALAGCSGSKASSSSVVNGSPVILGTIPNSLPVIPAQTKVNTYVGLAVGSNVSWKWYLSQPDQTYSYNEQVGVANPSQPSAGILSSAGDFEYLADDLFPGIPYEMQGLNVEVPSGVSVLDPAINGSPILGTLVLGVPLPTGGCLAPNGTVAIDYLQIPVAGGISKTVATDPLYASAELSYTNGTFSYSNAQQFGLGGATASTNAIPFVDSYCIQADAGYGIQAVTGTASTSAGKTLITYVGTSGLLVEYLSGIQNGGGSLVGIVEPSAPIDVSAVTAGTYRGYYDGLSSSGYADPAYFGIASAWVASPTLKQTGSSLVGGYVDFSSWVFTYPPTPVPGTILINFGTQDSSHPGLFPSATITEPSTASCPASDQSTGSDGTVNCTFPVAALVGKTYGKYVIFVSGPELTTGNSLFYALVQD